RDGRLDLLALTETGHPAQLLNRGVRDYGWLQVWFESVEPDLGVSDQRINSFGVGGEAEVRTGTLVQKHPITAPQVHIGLGTHKKAQLLRVVWTNGTFQTEFDLAGEQHVPVVQRLKGSCPY